MDGSHLLALLVGVAVGRFYQWVHDRAREDHRGSRLVTRVSGHRDDWTVPDRVVRRYRREDT